MVIMVTRGWGGKAFPEPWCVEILDALKLKPRDNESSRKLGICFRLTLFLQPRGAVPRNL